MHCLERDQLSGLINLNIVISKSKNLTCLVAMVIDKPYDMVFYVLLG